MATLIAFYDNWEWQMTCEIVTQNTISFVNKTIGKNNGNDGIVAIS